jgi:hypothetical protein
MWKSLAFALALAFVQPHILVMGLNCLLCKMGQNKKPTVINNKLKLI